MRSYRTRLLACAVLPTIVLAEPAMAEDHSVELENGIVISPLLDLRLRYETVDQDSAANDADAVTARMRAGVEAKKDGFFVLVEGEGTLAIVDDYNDTIPNNNGFIGAEPYPVVADPENIELNRAQIGYMKNGTGVTLGRQRIILDNARFVGNVGWRQNEQTFDAVRAQAKIGPVSANAIYSNSQRTIFGKDSPNEYFDGDIVLLNASADVKPVKLTAFSYLIDYDTRLAFSSKTFGAMAKASVPLGAAKLDLTAAYAKQSDYGDNPTDYSADYVNLELGTAISGFSLKAGYEMLGADEDAVCATGGCGSFQTPLATLHAFNGWADVFLTTPFVAGSFGGIEDYYVSIGKGFKVPAIPGLKAGFTYHKFESDFGGVDYGEEYDAMIGASFRGVGLLLKYAHYDADEFGTDTKKLWLQAEYKF